MNWDDLIDCLQNIKKELLKNDTVEIAEEGLSRIMWMDDMCRTFVFEVRFRHFYKVKLSVLILRVLA